MNRDPGFWTHRIHRDKRVDRNGKQMLNVRTNTVGEGTVLHIRLPAMNLYRLKFYCAADTSVSSRVIYIAYEFVLQAKVTMKWQLMNMKCTRNTYNPCFDVSLKLASGISYRHMILFIINDILTSVCFFLHWNMIHMAIYTYVNISTYHD